MRTYTLPCCWPLPETALIFDMSTAGASFFIRMSRASVIMSVGVVTTSPSLTWTPPDVLYCNANVTAVVAGGERKCVEHTH